MRYSAIVPWVQRVGDEDGEGRYQARILYLFERHELEVILWHGPTFNTALAASTAASIRLTERLTELFADRPTPTHEGVLPCAHESES